MNTPAEYAAFVSQQAAKYPPHLVPLSPDKWGELDFITAPAGCSLVQMMRSSTILAALFKRVDGWSLLGVALTIVEENGRHMDGLNWDDLMSVKRQAGLARLPAVEVYPADLAVIDVLPIRWLWFPPYQLPCFL